MDLKPFVDYCRKHRLAIEIRSVGVMDDDPEFYFRVQLTDFTEHRTYIYIGEDADLYKACLIAAETHDTGIPDEVIEFSEDIPF